MRTYTKVASTVVATLGLALLSGMSAEASSLKYSIEGPDANFQCAGFHDDASSVPGQLIGQATFKLSPDGQVLKTSTRLTGAVPNARYQIQVVQEQADCDTVDGLITTDARGNGSATLSETVDHGAVAARILIRALDSTYLTPTYRTDAAFIYPSSR